MSPNIPNAILVFGWNSFTNWLVFLTAFWHKTPIFLRGENPLNQEFLKSKWKIKIKKIVLSWLFRRVSAFLYIGEENKKFYQYYGVPDEKLFFVPYAVDNERFIKEVTSDKRQKTRDKYSIGEKDIVILFVGKLIEKKRPFDLLKAYEIITRNIRISPNMPNKVKIIEKELSYKLTGIFFEIHNELGRFAKERQYADAFEIKLKDKVIDYRREFAIDVAGRKSNIADFIIEGKILVEFKRKPVNTGEDYKQVMRYLESVGLELGFLVNFGPKYLKPKRILNPSFRRNPKYPNAPEYNESFKKFANSDTFVNSGYGSLWLVFVGDGALRSELENYAKAIIRNIRMYPNITNEKHNKHLVNSDTFVNSGYGIHFAGFQNQTELPQYYAMADIFVLPSGAGETWGLAVNEAMCFGLPIIVSDVVGCGPDLVKTGENGYIFPLGNIEKLAEQLKELILNKSGRKIFGKKSFEIVQNNSYEKDIKGISEALNSIK